jgi:O-antigen/teichoic acid export membrane protein
MALTAMVFVWFYSGGIMDWLYPADTGHLDRLFQLTFSMFPAFCMMYLFATVLTARGEIMLLLKLAGGGALVALFANALLIHYYKAQGAAIASLIVEWGMAFAYLFFARKHVPWIWPAFWWLKCATLILSMAILNYVFCRLHITWFLAALLNIPCFLAIVYSIRFWQKEAIASYLREFRANRMGD